LCKSEEEFEKSDRFKNVLPKECGRKGIDDKI
jgi:hypothetical protein